MTEIMWGKSDLNNGNGERGKRLTGQDIDNSQTDRQQATTTELYLQLGEKRIFMPKIRMGRYIYEKRGILILRRGRCGYFKWDSVVFSCSEETSFPKVLIWNLDLQ